MSRGAEGHPLSRFGRVGVQRVVRRDQTGHIDEVLGPGDLPRSRVLHFPAPPQGSTFGYGPHSPPPGPRGRAGGGGSVRNLAARRPSARAVGCRGLHFAPSPLAALLRRALLVAGSPLAGHPYGPDESARRARTVRISRRGEQVPGSASGPLLV